jgi:hypothetical protein
MGDNQTLKKIGGRLREESRGLVEAELPERLRVLADRLAYMEKHPEPEDSRVTLGRSTAKPFTIVGILKRNVRSSAEFKLRARRRRSV